MIQKFSILGSDIKLTCNHAYQKESRYMAQVIKYCNCKGGYSIVTNNQHDSYDVMHASCMVQVQ